MDGMRKAALTLAALRDEDRDWMLARLPREERRAMRRLVREVAALGITIDAQTLRELTEPAAGPPGGAASERRLHSARAAELHGLLESEPEALIAAVLRAGAWPWRRDLLESLGPERRRRVEAARDPALEVRPRALQAACDAIEARLGPAPTAGTEAQADA
jgi:hypothetical protein